MKPTKQTILGLDIGSKRIGVAIGDSVARLASPMTTLYVDGSELAKLQAIIAEHEITGLAIGLPRNLSGEETAQSQTIRQYVDHALRSLGLPIAYQDESVTSVLAEDMLQGRKKAFTKADIDAEAAALILQDYLETHYG